MQKTLVQFLPGGGVDFYVFVLFEFVFLIRVPLSSSKSFSINMKRTIKTLHFLLILGNVWVQCNCQFRTILYILISYGSGTQSLQQVGFGDFFFPVFSIMFFFLCQPISTFITLLSFCQKSKLSQPQMKQRKIGKKNKTRGAWATTLT